MRLLSKSIDELLAISLESLKYLGAKKEALILLSFFLKKDKVFLLSNLDYKIDNYEGYLKLLARRVLKEPLEYITNSVSFYSKNFYVNQNVLIPRPETELLIDEIKNKLDKSLKYNFVEIGIGSGIISIILALNFKNSKFLAVDIDKKALEVAKVNIKKFSLEDRITLKHSNLLANVNEKIDILVSNPPYISKQTIIDENLEYEPKIALFGGSQGDELIRDIIDVFMSKDIKVLFCEMAYDQKDKVLRYLKNMKYKSLNFYKDLSNFNRGFFLEK